MSTNVSFVRRCHICLPNSYRGTLPPQLLLETVYSLQSILFPSYDPNSSDELDRLLRKQGFDPDLRLYEALARKDPDDFQYVYWGDRLSKLYDAVKNPPPRHRLGRWLELHATDRNALYVAIIALVFTAVFGFMSVAIAALQTWISWQAWKHPRNPDDSK